MKFIDRSIEIAEQLFPRVYESKTRYRTFHFAFIWKRNHLLSIGQNYPQNENHKALKFAKKFNLSKIKNYPYLHAEVDAIGRLWGKSYIDSSMKIVVIRLNKNLLLQDSKPCEDCKEILDCLGVEMWYSTRKGKVVCHGL